MGRIRGETADKPGGAAAVGGKHLDVIKNPVYSRLAVRTEYPGPGSTW